jgi:hypothetical protein
VEDKIMKLKISTKITYNKVVICNPENVILQQYSTVAIPDGEFQRSVEIGVSVVYYFKGRNRIHYVVNLVTPEDILDMCKLAFLKAADAIAKHSLIACGKFKKIDIDEKFNGTPYENELLKQVIFDLSLCNSNVIYSNPILCMI